MISIIVTKARNNIIGKNNELIWDLPKDRKRFESLTKNHTIIMGRNSFEKISKMNRNCNYVVFTHNPDYFKNEDKVELVNSIEAIQKYIDSDEEVFVVGGAMIYRLLFNYAKKIYVTQIDKDFDGDAFFPIIDEKKWKIEEKEDRKSIAIHHYRSDITDDVVKWICVIR